MFLNVDLFEVDLQQTHMSAWRRHGVGSMRDGRHRARVAQVASMAVPRLVFLLP